ncbi:tol-pal system protein YbgF [Thalassotalea sp. 1_MG-2023]|uniref:tol-pal system protein YbgF n=1 Tax=Thalassotalea sp. 1_MG-2023 TaxID=3062680 RepID=UPI0026E29BFE|nr:tol-pal system protein YbgF [Thalassotalea sp. 1_MG-2023]MDO6428458.1 tol-pal system protein YbgF [Thalassotalea sp. 1_MG-2023]
MKLNQVLFGVFSAAAFYGQAAEPAPVIDASNVISSATSSGSLHEQIEDIVRQNKVYTRNQIKMQRQLDELQNEVSELRGVTELHSHQLSQVLDRQKELYQELERRVSQALKPKTPTNTFEQATVSTPTVSPTVTNGDDVYNAALNLVLKEKRYDDAIPAFRQFITQFPNSSYAANAQYWLGQLLFSKGELAQAKSAFSVVVNQFKDSSKRSDAMLKLGMVEQKQNNFAQAKSIYQQLLSLYPDSSAAKLAQPRLSSLP